MAKKKKRKTRKYKKNLESQLTALERDLLGALEERLNRARSVSSHDPTEFMDIASDSELDDLAARIAESDSTKINEIEEALRRLREGNYGICRSCGEKISNRRLKARPFATQCIECKQMEERESGAAADYVPRSSHQGAQADVGTGENEDSPEVNELFRDVEAGEMF